MYFVRFWCDPSTTVSLFNSVCNSLILIAANRLARTAGQSGLW